MKRLIACVAVGVIAAVSFVGCKKGENSVDLFPKDDGSLVIAEFDGIKITDKYLKAYLDQLNPYLKARYNTPEKKEELVSKMIEGEVLAREALKKGVMSDPVLLTKIKSTISRHYSSTVLQKEVEDKIKVSDEDMKKYFEEHKKEFVQPEKVKASHILVKFDANKKGDKEAKAAAAKKILAEVKKGAKDPKSFTDLAAKYSEDEGSKKRGGDVGFFERTEEGGRMAKEFSDAAFALKDVDSISEIVESPFGFHIIKLTGKKERVEKTFDDVKSRIESTLKSEKRKGVYDETLNTVKGNLKFKLYKENVAKLDFGVPEKVQDANREFDKNGGGMNPLNTQKLQEAMKNVQMQPGQPTPGQAQPAAPAPEKK